MANGFLVDMDVLQQVTREMDESIHKFAEYMKTAYDSMQVLNTKWKGPANETFRLNFTMDYIMTEFDIHRMRAMINKIETARGRYRASEDEVLAEVNHIQI